MTSDYIRNLRADIGNRLLVLPSVAALIRNDRNELLFQQKMDGSWSLPAGMIEPGETPQEAVAREVLEETGIAVESVKLVDVFGGADFRFVYTNGDQVEYVVSVYECSGIQIQSSDRETNALKFWSKDEAPRLALPYPIDLLFPESVEDQ